MKDKIEEVLEKEIRPGLRMDGGDIKLVEVDEENGVVKVQLVGHCLGCPMSQFTMLNFVEKLLKERVPEVKEVIQVF